jgi:truncated hemoglobin YjbI
MVVIRGMSQTMPQTKPQTKTGRPKAMLTREHSSTKTRDYQNIFHDSYLRCVVSDQDGFFKRFYELFTAADSGVSRVFAETNMERQISMLQESLLYMIHFANSKTASVRMQRVATYHGSNELDVPSHLFDLWMDCLVSTVRERDPQFEPHIDVAWRVFFAPGIAYIKAHCSG